MGNFAGNGWSIVTHLTSGKDRTVAALCSHGSTIVPGPGGCPWAPSAADPAEQTPSLSLRAEYSVKRLNYTGVGKNRFTVVCMEKDMQVAIIMVALLTQKNVTMAPCT